MDTDLSPADATILIVDDEPVNLTMLAHLLRPLYKVRAANSGESALRAASTEPRPDLVLLDVSMPGMDGYTVLEHLRADTATQDIPVVFITALALPSDEERGLQLGALDYIAKPIKPQVVLARVRTQLEAKRARDWMRDQNAFLEAEVRRRMAENDLTQLVSIRALAHLAEIRDPETGNHILRTQGYVRELARRLRHHPRFEAVLTERYIDLLTRSAPLHDIGKVGIPDTILHKPGPLTPAEWTVMKTHARLGYDAIELAEADAARPVEFLSLAKEIARWHHEKWDGSGYPDGLAGDAIPVAARIMAVADVFDALMNARVYKAAMPPDEVWRILSQGSGKHFDADMIDAFLADFEVFTTIAARYSDNPPTGPMPLQALVSRL
ncbi:MAG: two-component system response regulator [Rubrivivax sp.]|nr:two-component system response regulator [Rubrivivax sp.]